MKRSAFNALATLAVALLAACNGNIGGSANSGGAGTSGGVTCGAGQTTCGSQCVNASSDPQNCGGCGKTCSAGQTCQAGACQCQAGLLSCAGSCVSSDATHCGSCTNACASGQVCSAGACASSCATGTTQCAGGSCANINGNDALNCGGCGMACPAGATCNAGACGCSVAGQMLCGGACIDTTTSTANCGGCGHACAAGQTCTNGACVGGGTAGTMGTGGTTGSGGSIITGTGGTGTTPPFEPVAAAVAARKVKNLLVGLAPTDADVMTATTNGAAGLQTLINTWMTDSQYSPFFQGKMVTFFRNFFQQKGFAPLDDFKPQLLQNGGFDFGPLGTGAVGDDAYFRLVQNLQDSFALTAWQTVAEGRPFTDVLTTTRYMMTTGLKSLYIQIEMPDDEPYAYPTPANKLQWKVDLSNTIALADSLNSSSANYLVFDDEPPATTSGFGLSPTCHGNAAVNIYGGANSGFNSPSGGPTGGYAQLFQRLLGYTPRWTFVGSPACWEHASKPYFTTADLSDWAWVTINHKTTATDQTAVVQPYDIPTLEKTTTLQLALPRVGFYTTPAYLALWNTNDSNQHRVTANQTLLVALGQSFTSANTIVPVSAAGLDSSHSVAGSECVGCHQGLDPLRTFWANQYDFNDRDDFPSGGTFNGGAKNPRPSTLGGTLAFGSVNTTGKDIYALGPLLLQATDTADPANPLSRFAIALTQQLCYFANSAMCLESDPEFRRVALAFQNSSYNFPTLIRELFSSPLVTNISMTATTQANGANISIVRRDEICAALSNRLAITDVCSLAAPIPSSTQKTTLTIVSSIAQDAFSRGSEIPVTPSDPNLFYRAASEMLCENVAPKVVDPTSGTNLFPSNNPTTAIGDLVTKIMGYPPSDANYAMAVTILTNHFNTAKASPNSATATNAMRSTFAAACQSPTSLAFGL
jgi:hypothetical protein